MGLRGSLRVRHCDVLPLSRFRPPAPAQSALGAALGRFRCWLSERFFSRLSIGARVAAITLTLAVPLNLVIAASVWHLSTTANETQRTSLLYTARSVAAAVDAKLGEYMALAQTLARSPTLLEDDLNSFEAEARRAFTTSDAWILVADPEGKQLFNMARRPDQPLPVRSPIPLAAQKSAFEKGSAIITDVRVGAVSQDWIINIEVPIFKNGKPFRELAVAAKAQSFLRLLNDQDIPKDWLACLIDHRGRFVARVPGHERNVGQLAAEGFRKVKDQEGVLEFPSVDGDPIVTGNAHSKISGWAVAIAVKKATMQAAAWDTISWAAILGGSLSLMSLLFAGTIARSITGPISVLRREAMVLPDKAALPMPPAGPPEVRDLWQALKASAQALRDSEERFRGVFQHAATGIVIRDMEERFLSCNPAYTKMLGYSEEELRALAFPTYVHPEDKDENIAACKRLAAGEISSFEIINRYVCKDSKSIWVHKFVSLLRDDCGKPTNILVLVTDITGQKLSEAALRASEERFRGIFEHAGTGIAIGDMEGRLQTGNPAYCSMLGYTKEELRELTIHDLMHPEDFEECMCNFHRLVTQEIPSFETLNRYVAKDGKPVWVHKHVSCYGMTEARLLVPWHWSPTSPSINARTIKSAFSCAK